MYTCASSSRTRTAVTRAPPRRRGIYLDYARQKVTVHTIDLLINVARACNVEEKRDAMFRGEVMNPTRIEVCATPLRWRDEGRPLCDRGGPGHVRPRFRFCAGRAMQARQGEFGRSVD